MHLIGTNSHVVLTHQSVDFPDAASFSHGPSEITQMLELLLSQLCKRS